MSVIYISEQGAYLKKSSGTFVVLQHDEEIFSIPENIVERFVILGNVQVSTQAMNEIMAKGIEIVFLSQNGRFKGMLQPGYPKNIFVRLSQYESALDRGLTLQIAKHVVKEKIISQSETLRKWKENGWLSKRRKEFPDLDLMELLERAKTLETIMGIEASSAKNYFISLGQTVPPPFQWKGRNRLPPLDPVNALLSLTYMMVLGEIVSSCYAHGLDPFIGFLHHLDYGRPSFALDVIEPLRSRYCDHFVLKALNSEHFSEDDFMFSEKNGCRLKSVAFKRYLNLYSEKLLGENGRALPLRTCIKKSLQNIRDIFAQKTTPSGSEKRIFPKMAKIKFPL